MPLVFYFKTSTQIDATARQKQSFCFYYEEAKWTLSFTVLLTNQFLKPAWVLFPALKGYRILVEGATHR